MNEDLDLLRRAIEEPVSQMLLAEVVSPTHSNELARQIRAWLEPLRPMAEFGFNANRDNASILWEQCREAVAHWNEDNPGLLLVRDDSPAHVRIAHGASDKPTSIGFWRTMNQLREKWDSLPAQTLFLVTHEQYFFLTTESDHFKRWIPLKLHLPGPQEAEPRRLTAPASYASNESFTASLLLDDLEDQEAARQNRDAYQERLRHALQRGESAQTLARRYYLPLMAATIALQKWEEAANYNTKIGQIALSESQQLRWLRLRSHLEEAQGNIAEAVATAEERLKLAEELDTESVKEQRQNFEPSRNTVSALYALYSLHNQQRNFDEAERWLLHGLKIAPKEIIFLGNYALFLKNVRRDYEKAEVFFQRAVEADSEQARSLNQYALFLTDIRQNHDRAEALYKRAIRAAPEDIDTLGNYANFLTGRRQDHDKAEEFYQRALEVDPKDVATLNNYAVFLCLRRHNFEQAGIYFRRAVELTPDNPQHVINYAALCLSQGQKDEGKATLERAAAMPNLSDVQQVGISFHRYIHFPEEVPSPLKELKRVLKSGKRAKGWTFDLNIERAQQDKHPSMRLLKALTSVIAEEKDSKILDTFREWRIA